MSGITGVGGGQVGGADGLDAVDGVQSRGGAGGDADGIGVQGAGFSNKRARSIDMGSLGLLADLESKLAAQGNLDVGDALGGEDGMAVDAAMVAAIARALPGFDIHGTEEMAPAWLLTPKYGKDATISVEIADGKVHLHQLGKDGAVQKTLGTADIGQLAGTDPKSLEAFAAKLTGAVDGLADVKPLAKGAKGPEVLYAQQLIGMASRNQDPAMADVMAGLGDDGVFGAKMEQVLKKYQETHGLPVTGKLDGKTEDALRQDVIQGALEKGQVSEFHFSVLPPMEAGASGDEVKVLQLLLKRLATEGQDGGSVKPDLDPGEIDGQLGPKTLQAAAAALAAAGSGAMSEGSLSPAALQALRQEFGAQEEKWMATMHD
jgi:peptidoglycan hydrolase-like protein with peptidoglycan-binding domain